MSFLANANWGVITFYLKAVIAGWSLLVLAVDAAFIAKFNSYCEHTCLLPSEPVFESATDETVNYWAGYYYRGSGFSSANVSRGTLDTRGTVLEAHERRPSLRAVSSTSSSLAPCESPILSTLHAVLE